ncbi:asparagine synthetase domain-containing protein 1 isoform X2 [Canna indica]|uniref:Asparagine synthetase domain-containing protein 1 isoform X2 n=1 Tax=Canna indica TaxID=4628 RepID=A0AAQ3PWD6_9LILI|nr:asparagine synthetase domain-containing protein 1 isoform X2 [Canna indica]
MCGIALILSGVDIEGSDLYKESRELPSSDADEPDLVVEDLKDAIGRRGPDSLGSRRVLIKSNKTNSDSEDDGNYYVEEDLHIRLEENAKDNHSSTPEDTGAHVTNTDKSFAELYFLGATLQLRGVSPIFQPLVDSSGNILVFNGEIFGGIHVSDERNDAETLLHVLESCCYCNGDGHEEVCSSKNSEAQSIPEIISSIKGPWALIYWQQKSRTLWFGRDAFGRRSLLVHWPTLGNLEFVLSSISPASNIWKNSETNCMGPGLNADVEDSTSKMCYWEELPCRLYSIHLKASKASGHLANGKLVGEFRKHRWTSPLLNRLIQWERTCVDPKTESFSSEGVRNQIELTSPEGMDQHLADVSDLWMEKAETRSDTNNHIPGDKGRAEKVLDALRESVMRRTVNRIFQIPQHEYTMDDNAPIALLFSGGLDSMILAAILDKCLEPRYAIDLLNVSFDGQLAPDRVSARTGVAELQKVAPNRRQQVATRGN